MKYLNHYSLLILRLVKLRESLLVILSQIVIIKRIVMKMIVIMKIIIVIQIPRMAAQSRIKIIKKRREMSDVGF
jgi:hypothetical protein